MDPALLAEREAFKKRALAQPSVEKRKIKSKNENQEKSAKKFKPSSSSKPKPPSMPNRLDYKSMSGSSQFKFGVLAKIVKYMKTRHQHGDTHPLTIEEILDETNQLDVSSKHRHWLTTEALLNNPKIKVFEGGSKFAFKPVYEISNRRGLLNLLKRHDMNGLGGILLEDVEESLPNCQKALKDLGSDVLHVSRGGDKKTILFYNDKYCQFTVDEEFQKQWRAVSVEGLDEKKIEEYLEKQGISSMQDTGVRKIATQKRKKGGNRKKTFKKHNEHLDGVLEDYSEIVNKS